MPWDSAGAKRHNHHLSSSQASRWASIANAILKRTGDEGKAIRVANSKFEGAAKRKLQKSFKKGGK